MKNANAITCKFKLALIRVINYKLEIAKKKWKKEKIIEK